MGLILLVRKGRDFDILQMQDDEGGKGVGK